MGESRIKTKLGQDISQRLNKPKSFFHSHTQTYTKRYIHLEIKTLFLKELRVNYFTLEHSIRYTLIQFCLQQLLLHKMSSLGFRELTWREERGICFSQKPLCISDGPVQSVSIYLSVKIYQTFNPKNISRFSLSKHAKSEFKWKQLKQCFCGNRL